MFSSFLSELVPKAIILKLWNVCQQLTPVLNGIETMKIGKCMRFHTITQCEYRFDQRFHSAWYNLTFSLFAYAVTLSLKVLSWSYNKPIVWTRYCVIFSEPFPFPKWGAFSKYHKSALAVLPNSFIFSVTYGFTEFREFCFALKEMNY